MTIVISRRTRELTMLTTFLTPSLGKVVLSKSDQRIREVYKLFSLPIGPLQGLVGAVLQQQRNNLLNGLFIAA